MVSRRIVWLPAIKEKYRDDIASLEKKLAHFYANTPAYYAEIDFTGMYWADDSELGFRDIVETAKDKEQVLEVGCGSANILKHHRELQKKYYGCDFSNELLRENAEKYPDANFTTIEKPNVLPFNDSTFDLVFSVFVLEHSTNPSVLLNEFVRVLKKNGVLIILCPDFLGFGRMTSQRAGFSQGTSRDKIKQKKYFDALVTLFDNRIRIPVYCAYLRFKILLAPSFYINVCPTVFHDNFTPDVDAVYATYKNEIVRYLKAGITRVKNEQQLRQYEQEKKWIYVKFRRNS